MSDGLGELYRVSKAVLSVSRQMPSRDVLQMIVRSARTLVGARYAALGVPDERNSFAEFVVDGMSEAEQDALGPLPRRHGMLGVLLTEGKPERLADIRLDARFEGWPDQHPRMSHFLGVPVRAGGDPAVLAIIFAANKITPKSSGFTDRDEEILSLFAAHAAIALTNARLYDQSRELTVLTERARLARELHDAVTQKLFSIRAHARAAAVLAQRSGGTDDVLKEIEAVAALGADAHAELRAVIDGLAPPDLSAAGLAESLRRYAVMAGRAHGIPVSFTGPDEVPPLGTAVDAALYRVAQEALHNALRHARASEVRMALSGGGPLVVLEVCDDGPGFNVAAALSGVGPPAGLGLASMRERAAAVGGSLEITSGSAGSTVRMTVPATKTGRPR